MPILFDEQNENLKTFTFDNKILIEIDFISKNMVTTVLSILSSQTI